MTQLLFAWLADRLDSTRSRASSPKETAPSHRHSVWYYLGGITLFLFGVQVATGILLLLYYRPSAAEAYESVQFIVIDVPFGWLIRSSTPGQRNLMILAARPHVQRVLPARPTARRAS